MESPPNAPSHLQKWEREPQQERDPRFAGQRIPVLITILCSWKIMCVLCVSTILLIAGKDVLSGTQIALTISSAVLQVLAYSGCLIGAQKKNFVVLSISAGLLCVLIFVNIGSNTYNAVDTTNTSERELERRVPAKYRDDFDAKKVKDQAIPQAVVSILCHIFYNGAIVGLCAFYARHIKKGRALESDVQHVLLPP